MTHHIVTKGRHTLDVAHALLFVGAFGGSFACGGQPTSDGGDASGVSDAPGSGAPQSSDGANTGPNDATTASDASAASTDGGYSDASATDSRSGADAGVSTDAGFQCSPPGGRQTGTVREVRSGESIAAAVTAASAGDTVRVRAGTYPALTLSGKFSSMVLVTAADGEAVTVRDLTFKRASYIAVRGMRVTGPTLVEESDHVELRSLEIDPGSTFKGHTLFVRISNNVDIIGNKLLRGVRCLNLGGENLPPAQWKVRAVRIIDNDFSEAERFIQITGASELLIEHNYFHDHSVSDWIVGILAAGADKTQILRNHLVGPGARDGDGIYVEHASDADQLSTSNTIVANNLVRNYPMSGIRVLGAVNTDVVNNTAFGNGTRSGGADFFTDVGSYPGRPMLPNTNVRVWNNIFGKARRSGNDTPLSLATNNLVVTAGFGQSLINSDPKFADQIEYRLTATSPAVRAGAPLAGTPLTDLDGVLRGSPPDLGARQLGGTRACPQ